MLASSKFTKMLGIFGSPVLLIIIFYAFYHSDKKEDEMILRMHCNTINSDFTRPDKRMCVQGLEFKDDLFYFKTKENKVEVYEVIKDTSSGDDNKDKYLYVYKTTTTQ